MMTGLYPNNFITKNNETKGGGNYFLKIIRLNSWLR